THCTQNRSGEKRRFRTAHVSRPEIITSAWMVSSVRWCSRTRNPLPGMRRFLPRKGEHRLPSREVIDGAVEDQNAEQGQTAAGTAQMRPQAIEEGERRGAFHRKRQVSQIAWQRHLEHLWMVKKGDRVDPSTCAAPAE